MWFSYKWEVYRYKTRFNPPFRHRKMTVTSQEYDSCYPFIWCVCAFDFAIWLRTFRFEFSSEFSIFVILLFFFYLFVKWHTLIKSWIFLYCTYICYSRYTNIKQSSIIAYSNRQEIHTVLIHTAMALSVYCRFMSLSLCYLSSLFSRYMENRTFWSSVLDIYI